MPTTTSTANDTVKLDSSPSFASHVEAGTTEAQLDAKLYHAEDGFGASDGSLASGNLNYALLQERLGSDLAQDMGALESTLGSLDIGGGTGDQSGTLREISGLEEGPDGPVGAPALQEGHRPVQDVTSTNVAAYAGKAADVAGSVDGSSELPSHAGLPTFERAIETTGQSTTESPVVTEGPTINIVETTVNVVNETVNNVNNDITNILGDVTETVDDVVDDVTDAVDDIVDDVTDTVGDVVDAATDTVGDVVDAATDTVDDVVDAATDTAGAVIETVTGAVDDVLGDPTSLLDDIVGDGSPVDLGLVDTTLDTATDTVGDVVDEVTDTAGAVIETVTGAVDDVLGDPTSLLDGVVQDTGLLGGGSGEDDGDTDLTFDLLATGGDGPVADSDGEVTLDPIEAILGDIDIDIDGDAAVPDTSDVTGVVDGVVQDTGLLGGGSGEDDGDTDLTFDLLATGGDGPVADSDGDVTLDPIEAILGDIDIDASSDLTAMFDDTDEIDQSLIDSSLNVNDLDLQSVLDTADETDDVASGSGDFTLPDPSGSFSEGMHMVIDDISLSHGPLGLSF